MMVDTLKVGEGTMTETFVMNMIRHISSGKLIEKETVLHIIETVNKIIRVESCLTEVKLEEKILITVCGDIHGQLFDLLEIFKQNGNPSEDHIYLFNGDIVDRGPCSIEVALILYAYKLLLPRKFFINKGNHETKHKYTQEEFKRECLENFEFLPLAAVVGSVFVVHGGPPIDVDFSLEKIRTFERTKGQHSDMEVQLLWNDPAGLGKAKTPRGGGKLFGRDVVDRFLEREGLSLIIRSHELTNDMADGYKRDGKCLTVFSAASYIGGDNFGAYVNISTTSLKVETFRSPSYPEGYNPWKYLM